MIIAEREVLQLNQSPGQHSIVSSQIRTIKPPFTQGFHQYPITIIVSGFAKSPKMKVPCIDLDYP